VTTVPDDDGWLLRDLAAAPVMAILRGDAADALVEPALALLDGGIRLVEVSLTTPGACGAIEQIRDRAPAGARMGAGTVGTAGPVADVAAAGGEFVVTPALADSLAAAVRRGLPVAAGAFSPTEVLAARQTGADVVKLFPASFLGAGYLAALRGPFPDIPLMAVGGVGIAETAAFLRAGAVAVGVGGPLLGGALRDGDLDALRERARAYLRAATEATTTGAA
jgi:2-dehydro-3-deoxyphosphogluconate aldolase/(4S)-4-hydroxy-2-oxoglutarate aldolase